MPTFPAPAIDGAVLTFQLIVNDGVVDSPADPVVITVKAKGRLELRPVIAPIVDRPGHQGADGDAHAGERRGPRDVSADPGTTYRWIGNGLVSGADGLPNVTPILNAIATKLGVPIQIADISVDTAGMLTVNTPGLQVVRAHYKDADGELDSGFSVVLAGIKLKGIALKPESVLTTLAGTLSDAMGSGKNPPMILAAAANGYVLDKGVVLLDDVTFELLGHGDDRPEGSRQRDRAAGEGCVDRRRSPKRGRRPRCSRTRSRNSPGSGSRLPASRRSIRWSPPT